MADDNVTRSEFESLVKSVAENTKLTQEVRDILATFHVLFKVAKFVAAIATAAAAVVAFGRMVKGGW